MTNSLLYATILFVLSPCCSARSEEIVDARAPEGLVTLGVGGGYFGPTVYSGLAYIVNNNVIAVRYWKADEFRFNPGGANYDEPALRCMEFGVLYGRTLRKENLELSASAGVAYLDGIDRGSVIRDKQFEQIRISTMGIPFEARFRFDWGIVSLGGAWYGNVNPIRYTNGAMLQLSVEPFGD